jgi:type II secretory pathway component GspD/PulD (secretin)
VRSPQPARLNSYDRSSPYMANALVARPEGTWIVPAQPASGGHMIIRVIRLTYVDADDIAWTLSWAAPPGVRIVPFQATNSVVVSGPEALVDQMVDVIRRR